MDCKVTIRCGQDSFSMPPTLTMSAPANLRSQTDRRTPFSPHAIGWTLASARALPGLFFAGVVSSAGSCSKHASIQRKQLLAARGSTNQKPSRTSNPLLQAAFSSVCPYLFPFSLRRTFEFVVYTMRLLRVAFAGFSSQICRESISHQYRFYRQCATACFHRLSLTRGNADLLPASDANEARTTSFHFAVVEANNQIQSSLRSKTAGFLSHRTATPVVYLFVSSITNICHF